MAIHLAGWCAGRQSLLPPLLLEIFVEVVEHLGATRDAIRVILGRHADPFDQRPDAGDLRPAEFVVLQVDVVDDFRDGAQRRVFWHAALQQHLERALVALMRELGLEHVETQFGRIRAISLSGYELEAGLWINETAYQPGAGDPIHIDALSRHPGPIAKRAKCTFRGVAARFAFHHLALA